ncbi:MAG: hypothetical protein H3C33_01905 [Rhodocyclaceae bacterium]|jgi:hypothetical protein|nr:hypothetical protein [Rhodocyclaceae bacterium]
MPTEHPFDTYAEYRRAVLELLRSARQTIVLFDPDLSQTGIESLHGAEAIAAFCERTTFPESLRIALHSPRYVERECPRLLRLVSQFGHRITIRITSARFRNQEQPFLVVDGEHYVTRFHQDDPRGKLCMEDGEGAATLLSHFEILWQHARPGPTGTPLGI